MAKLFITIKEPPRYKAPLSEQHLLALGQLAAEYSLMAAAAEVGIWHLAGDNPEDGRQTTGRLTFENRMKKLVALGKDFPFNRLQREAFGAYISAMRTASNERGAMMHGIWHESPLKDSARSVSPRKGPRGRIVLAAKDYTPDAIQKLAAQMSELSHAFLNFLELNAER